MSENIQFENLDSFDSHLIWFQNLVLEFQILFLQVHEDEFSSRELDEMVHFSGRSLFVLLRLF